jgi:hypothetical protein
LKPRQCLQYLLQKWNIQRHKAHTNHSYEWDTVETSSRYCTFGMNISVRSVHLIKIQTRRRISSLSTLCILAYKLSLKHLKEETQRQLSNKSRINSWLTTTLLYRASALICDCPNLKHLLWRYWLIIIQFRSWHNFFSLFIVPTSWDNRKGALKNDSFI